MGRPMLRQNSQQRLDVVGPLKAGSREQDEERVNSALP